MKTLQERYREYLQSDDWKEKRKRKLRTHKSCGICQSRKQLDVHHLNYRAWTNVLQSDLRVLCRRCHDTAHQLMRYGVLVYRSDNHNSRWALTKNAVLKAIGHQIQPRKKPRATFAKYEDGPVITHALLQSVRSVNGGWTKPILQAFGVSWPPPKGWKKRLIGLAVPLRARVYLVDRRPPEPSEDDRLFAWMNRI